MPQLGDLWNIPIAVWRNTTTRCAVHSEGQLPCRAEVFAPPSSVSGRLAPTLRCSAS